ncbi:hypothetical protein, partial [Campylobacter sp. VBCF_08 NA3]|uniref:hypothetical protein n=1 Tax=Campylobacter sp. VBCF_08 NA3 TaxID=2983833 RepID=UPI0022E9A5DF
SKVLQGWGLVRGRVASPKKRALPLTENFTAQVKFKKSFNAKFSLKFEFKFSGLLRFLRKLAMTNLA